MTISKELYLAILSMDAYNRGYGAGIADGGKADTDGLGEAGSQIGKQQLRQLICPLVPKPQASTPSPMTTRATA